jgi:hypothetical protein
MRTRRRAAAAALVVLSALLLRGGDVVASAPEFVAASCESPRVGSDASGNFVVAGTADDGDGYGIVARRFDASGAALGAEFVVNAATTGTQRFGDLAVADAGSFVVTWTDATTQLFARRFDATGAPLGGDFVVNATPVGVPRVAVDPSGGFVVAWRRHGSFSASDDVFARRYDAAGSPLAAEFQVNTTPVPYGNYAVAVAFDPMSNFVVAWSSEAAGTVARRYDTAGVPLSGEFQVSTGIYPVATRTPTGFVVAWADMPLGNFSIAARRYDTAGTPIGSDVSLRGPGDLFADIAVTAAGRMMLVWREFGESFRPIRSWGRLYEADGTPRGDPFVLATLPKPFETATNVTHGGSDDFIAAWSSRSIIDQPGVGLVRRITAGRIHGKQCQVTVTSTGARRIRCEAQERSSPTMLFGDPGVAGATLRVVAEGATPSDQTFTLPPGGGWESLDSSTTGFVYRDPDQLASPVKYLSLKRRLTGTVAIKTAILGTDSVPFPGVDIVPPDPGASLALVLEIEGNAYCTSFGAGQGGGDVRRNDADAFRIQRPPLDGLCPTTTTTIP